MADVFNKAADKPRPVSESILLLPHEDTPPTTRWRPDYEPYSTRHSLTEDGNELTRV